MQVVIINKKQVAGKVRAVTVEGDAKKDKDYKPVDEIVRFEQGQKEAKITITIIDDDQWNPDREFFVKLYDANSDELLTGKDRETRITIIDDDKPGYIAFEKKDGSIKVSADS
jgi:solute carrier family 8 (sodium/calcium exchanger)